MPPEILKRLKLKEGQELQSAFAGAQTLCLTRPGASTGNGSPSLFGRIETLGVADLFSLLNMTQKTGVLTVESGQTVKSTYFHNGEIVFARSNLMEDRIGSVLYRTGRITTEQLKLAEAAITPRKRFGSILIEKGVLTTKTLWEAVKYQVEEIAYSMFALHEGEFLFYDGQELEEDLVGFQIGTQGVLMEGFQRLDEYQLIREKIPSGQTIFHLNDPLPDLEISEREKNLLSMIDGMSDVETLIRNSRMGEFNCMKALFRLLKMGFLIPMEVGEAVPHPSEQIIELEEGVIDEDDKLYKIIGKYNRIFSFVVRNAAEAGGGEAFINQCNSFFDDLPEKLEVLFKGVRIGEDGSLDPMTLHENAGKSGAGSSGGGGGGGLLKIAGLKDLFAETKLLDGCNELLNFLLFTAKNVLDPDAADRLTHQVRDLQKKM